MKTRSMTLRSGYDRKQMYDSIRENEFDTIEFNDAFTEETRKIRRNLIFSCFVCLTVIVLQLKISTFMGIAASSKDGVISTEIASGILLLIACYFGLSFLLSGISDMVAWKAKKERIMLEPYIEFLLLIEEQFSSIREQLQSAKYAFEGSIVKDNFQNSAILLNKALEDKVLDASFINKAQEVINVVHTVMGNTSTAKNTIESVNNQLKGIYEDILPITNYAKVKIITFKWVNYRFIIRIVSLVVIDWIVPLSLWVIAISMSYQNLINFIQRVFNPLLSTKIIWI